MSTLITRPPRRATAQPQGETRILVPNASWTLYESFVMKIAREITNPDSLRRKGHGDHGQGTGARSLRRVYLACSSWRWPGQLGIRIKPQGETTWIRPEIERGIEADKCYYLEPAKIATALAAISRRVNDVAAYPNPDLAIEVDISAPQADRASIYAALGVAELWIFDGQTLTIERLDEQGRYQPVERSGFLRVRADQVPRWLTAEDISDYDAWIRRVREWAGKELHGH